MAQPGQPDQSDFLIYQWLREVRPRPGQASIERRSSGFGQKKIRDPLPLNFPLGFGANNGNTVKIPTIAASGIVPVVDEGSSDIYGGSDTTTGGTPPSSVASTAGSSGGSSGTATGTPTAPITPDTFHTTVVTGASGTPHTLISFDTGGGADHGCYECNFGVIDPRLLCFNPYVYCPSFNGDAVLCGLGGVFCPHDRDCNTSNCAGPHDGSCCLNGRDADCQTAGVICCYSDGSQLGSSRRCCDCPQ